MPFSGLFVAILASLTWGTADFAGGAATRRHHQFQVILFGSLAALLPLALVAWLAGETLPDLRSALWALLAGGLGAFGLTAFYLGLARSSMAVVAPTASVIGTILPMTFSLVRLGLPAPLQLVGFFAALLGIFLATRAHPEQAHHVRQGFLLAAAAGVSFGIFLTLISQVAPEARFGSLVCAKAAGAVVTFLLIRRQGLPVLRLKDNWIAPLAGILDAGGNSFYLLATHLTRMDVAVVLASMGPVWTVVLARWLFKERVQPVQWLGVGLCMLAIALISL